MPVITFVLNGAPVSIDADDDDEHGRGHVPLRHVLRHRRAVSGPLPTVGPIGPDRRSGASPARHNPALEPLELIVGDAAPSSA